MAARMTVDRQPLCLVAVVLDQKSRKMSTQKFYVIHVHVQGCSCYSDCRTGSVSWCQMNSKPKHIIFAKMVHASYDPF